jgi:hypothetical protein
VKRIKPEATFTNAFITFISLEMANLSLIKHKHEVEQKLRQISLFLVVDLGLLGFPPLFQLLLDLCSFDFGHEIEALMEKSSEQENAVEKDWGGEDDADEQPIGVEVLLLGEAMPIPRAKFIEKLAAVDEEH